MANARFKKHYEVRDRDGNRHALFDEQKEADEFVRQLTGEPSGSSQSDDDVRRASPAYTISEVRALSYGDAPGDEKRQLVDTDLVGAQPPADQTEALPAKGSKK